MHFLPDPFHIEGHASTKLSPEVLKIIIFFKKKIFNKKKEN